MVRPDASGPALSPLLIACGLGVLFLVVLALGKRWSGGRGAEGPRAAALELVDGDADAHERERLLHVIVEQGLGPAEQDPLLAYQTASAALLLGDEEVYEAAVMLWPRNPTLDLGVPLSELALGEAAIEQFYRGFAHRYERELAQAVAAFDRAIKAAVMAELPLVEKLARHEHARALRKAGLRPNRSLAPSEPADEPADQRADEGPHGGK